MLSSAWTTPLLKCVLKKRSMESLTSDYTYQFCCQQYYLTGLQSSFLCLFDVTCARQMCITIAVMHSRNNQKGYGTCIDAKLL